MELSEEKNFLWKKLFFSIKFGLSAKRLGVLAENFQKSFQNWILISGVLAGKNPLSCENWILRPRRNVSKENVFELKPIFYRFRSSNEIFRTFSEALLAALPNLQPNFPKYRLGEKWKFFQKHSLLYLFRTFSKNVSADWRSFLGSVVETKFWVSRGRFLRKKSFQ